MDVFKKTEWTITINTNSYDGVYQLILNDSGTGAYISSHESGNSQKRASDSLNYRPVFYLLSTVAYASGSGTSSDPIRIN